jgi:hypothetical protein
MPEQLEVPLSQAIRALRREIVDANRTSKDEEIRFKLGPIELEFGLEVAREAGGEAGLRFWVVSIGAMGKRASAATHTVKMVLTPVGADILVSDEDAAEPE